MRLHGMTLIILVSLVCALRADFFEITVQDLQKKYPEINYNLLDPINLSYNGSFFVAVERISGNTAKTPEERKAIARRKAEGYTRILRVFRFKDKQLERVDSIPIPVTDWINGAVGTGKRENDVFIIGDYGNKILRVDLTKNEVHTLFEYQKGKAGFKAGPFLLCHKGNFYATGWAYDSQQIFQGDYIVKLQEEGKKGLKLTPTAVADKGVRLDTLYRSKEGYAKVYFYISGEQFLYNWIVPHEKMTYLKLYRKGEGSQTIAQGYMLVIFIGTDNKIFYSVIKEKDGSLRHYLVDIKDGDPQNTIQIGEDNDPFTYPFLSEDGNVLVVVVLDNKYKKVTAYMGKKEEGYRLKKFLHRVEPGAMKLSGDGKVFLLMNEQGFRVHYFD